MKLEYLSDRPSLLRNRDLPGESLPKNGQRTAGLLFSAGLARSLAARKAKKKAQLLKENRRQLQEQLNECRFARQQNERFFNMAEDAPTVESCIWQNRALLAREDMLTAKIRALEAGTAPADALPAKPADTVTR